MIIDNFDYEELIWNHPDRMDPYDAARLLIAEEAELKSGSLTLCIRDMDYLPKEISKLQHLKSLDLFVRPNLEREALKVQKDSRILGLSKNTILDGIKLERYRVAGQGSIKIIDLSVVSSISSLEKIFVNRVGIDSLGFVSGLKNLKEIDCSNNFINNLSPLQWSASLKKIDCGYNKIESIDPISNLKSLEYFDCSCNGIVDLNPLSGLKSLKWLDLTDLNITDLSSLRRIVSLNSLILSRCSGRDLGPLSALTSLSVLESFGGEIEDLDPITRLPNLTKLGVSGNRHKIHNLSGFIAGNTQRSLRHIEASWSRFAKVDPAVWRLPSLSKVVAHGASIDGLPNELFQNGARDTNHLDTIRAYYEDLDEDRQGPAQSRDIKLMLLGNGKAGKTQIRRRLEDPDSFTMDEDWDSTHGISVRSATLPGPGDTVQTSLSVWDFGGQDLYHGTHSLFLTGRCLPVIVWSEETEHAEDQTDPHGVTCRNDLLSYWVHVVRATLGEVVPLIIVQTRCDQPKQGGKAPPIDPEVLNTFGWHRVVHIGSETGRGWPSLIDAIQQATDILYEESIGHAARVGASRLQLKRFLEALLVSEQQRDASIRRARILSFDRFQQMCGENGGISSPTEALNWLHSCGTVYWRDGVIGNQIILDQGWVLEAIYAVFDRTEIAPLISERGGRFTPALLAQTVWRERSEEEQKLFLLMMQQSGVCFPIKFQDKKPKEFIAPELLPERDGIAADLSTWGFDKAYLPVELFDYAALHPGLVSCVLSAIGRVAYNNAIYWRGGVAVYDAQCKGYGLIEVIRDRSKGSGSISITTWGNGAGQMRGFLVGLVQIQERVLRIGSGRKLSIALALAHVTSTPWHAETGPTPVFQEPPEARGEGRWYVSYAWKDADVSDGNDPAVERICAAGQAKGHPILRDKDVLKPGQDLNGFMKRIGSGARIFVLLSPAYVRSANCMFELSEIWRESARDPDRFFKRARIFHVSDDDVTSDEYRLNLIRYWMDKQQELDDLTKGIPLDLIPGDIHQKFIRMSYFQRNIGEILGAIATHLIPRTWEEFERWGFDDIPTAPISDP